MFLFQSSPALTGGCYLASYLVPLAGSRFNPHPPLRADAIQPNTTTNRVRESFNPHPPLRADAMPYSSSPPGHMIRFNPHPPLRADAIGDTILSPACERGVSILTRPYGRMLSRPPPPRPPPPGVSILTRPYGRMLSARAEPGRRRPRGFNPHPPLRADAILGHGITSPHCSRFNPHPPLRADAMRDSGEGPNSLKFQSSPALTGGCYSCKAWCCAVRGCFNPHPPLRADAITRIGPGYIEPESRFNPHPPLRADAMSFKACCGAV